METTEKALIDKNLENKLEKLGARVQTRKNTREWLLKIEIKETIDVMNNYLEGDVTPLDLRMALNNLINIL